mmetsp:Transcript_87341/g.250275  ORF Transcript_87341/g.250275 Transcript_87341/m.250275 type:complete len:231 (+) Transcript_87341:335-1027(+)
MSVEAILRQHLHPHAGDKLLGAVVVGSEHPLRDGISGRVPRRGSCGSCGSSARARSEAAAAAAVGADGGQAQADGEFRQQAFGARHRDLGRRGQLHALNQQAAASAAVRSPAVRNGIDATDRLLVQMLCEDAARTHHEAHLAGCLPTPEQLNQSLLGLSHGGRSKNSEQGLSARICSILHHNIHHGALWSRASGSQFVRDLVPSSCHCQWRRSQHRCQRNGNSRFVARRC